MNTAVTTGTTPAGGDVTASDDESVPAGVPTIKLLKTAEPSDTDGDGEIGPGETITYSFDVTNTGNVGLDQVAITDDLLDDLGIDISCPETTLDPGETMTCTSEPYTVTDRDGDRSLVHNEATVAGCPLPSEPAQVEPAAFEPTAVLRAAAACIDAHDEVDVDVVPAADRGDLAGAGASSPAWLFPVGAWALIAGGAILLIGRRRRENP